MSDPRVAHCIFCDDVRQEVGNKFSFMGVYGSDIVIPNQFPAFIPKFAIVVWLICDVDDTPEAVTTSLILPDGNELFRSEVVKPPVVYNREGAYKLTWTSIFPFSPMPVPCAGMIEVWVETDAVRLRAGRLKVRSELDQTPET